MSESIRVYIERLKSACEAVTDQELADKLGYSKQAIASWRRRGNVPVTAELKIVEALGPGFARSPNIRGVALMREREVVDAVSLFVCERFILSLKNPPSIKTRRSLGYLFQEIQGAIRNEVRDIGFEYENSLTMLDVLMALVSTNQLPSIQPILARVDFDGNEVRTDKSVNSEGSQ